MDDPLLVRVIDGGTDLSEQIQPFARPELFSVAEFRDRNAPDQFHDEERPPLVRGSGVEYFGDVRVIHHRQRLTLGFKAGDDRERVHAQLDDFQCHPPRHRLHLFRHPYGAESSFPDLLKQLVTADPLSCGFAGSRNPCRHRPHPLLCRIGRAHQYRCVRWWFLCADAVFGHHGAEQACRAEAVRGRGAHRLPAVRAGYWF